ncbi:MAG: 2Fe-2S iron-sulfur cluster binding domain-containing protein [Alphaproteobacteria bacterium]|nr:2Fe-2S iron-sulfur cluster binding domain-containing protein [Alphaproteobacteria bacterium]
MASVVVRCEPLGVEVAVAPGQTLLAALRAAGVPIGAACDGDGICARCGLRVLAGDAPPPEAAEARALAREGFKAGVRLACCVRPTEDLVVRAAYW